MNKTTQIIIYVAYLLACAVFGTLLGVALAHADCSDAVTNVSVKEQKDINTQVPKHLRGAVITVQLADGSVSSVPAERFKIVPRKQQFVVTKVQQDTLRTCSRAEKNRVSLLAGQGPKGRLTRTHDGNYTSVESQYGFTGGLQYQRNTDLKLMDMPVSFGVQLQDNETGLGMVGVEF